MRLVALDTTMRPRHLYSLADDSALVDLLAQHGALLQWAAGPALDIGGHLGLDLVNLQSDMRVFLRLPRERDESLPKVERRLAGFVASDTRKRLLLGLAYRNGQAITTQMY